MKKSKGVQFVLTFLLGPLGLLYSNVLIAVIMLAFAFFAVLFTGGLVVIPLWLISIIVGFVTVSDYNKKNRKHNNIKEKDVLNTDEEYTQTTDEEFILDPKVKAMLDGKERGGTY